MKLTKEEFDQKVRKLINPELEKKPEIANLLEMVGNQPRLPMQKGANDLMSLPNPTQNPTMNPSVNPMGAQSQAQTVTAMQKYPFLGAK